MDYCPPRFESIDDDRSFDDRVTTFDMGEIVTSDDGISCGSIRLPDVRTKMEFFVASELFSQHVYQLWNAAQPGSEYLTRTFDVENKSLIFFESKEARRPLRHKLDELLMHINALKEDGDDEDLQRRVAYIKKRVEQTLTKAAVEPELRDALEGVYQTNIDPDEVV